MKKLLIILSLAAITTAFSCNKNAAKIPTDPGGGTISADTTVKRQTPLGLTLASAKETPPDIDAVADASFAELVEDARHAGYTQNLNANLYTIIVKQDCQPSSDGTLAWRIRADDYDGSEYDQNPLPGIGEVLAAEQVVMNGYTPTNTYIICYGDAALMTNTVRYGLEHLILYYNDRAKYAATVNHGTSGIGHPLIAHRAN